MGDKLTWKDGLFKIDGQGANMISGEFHYFRVPKKDWHTRLRLWKEAGGNTVATYIPWLIHEPKEGELVFGRHDYDDLEGFLQACADEGLYVVARPGPYQYSELKYAGLPGWLCEGYPQLLAKNIEGESFNTMSVSYMHPLFVEKMTKWMRYVCAILKPWCVAEGGPIIALQLDNEAVGIHSWFNGGWYDYNRETFSIGKEEGFWPEYLKNKYKTNKALEEAWEEPGISFSTAMPICTAAKTPGQVRRLKDYECCYLAQVEAYFKLLRSLIHQAGIDEKLIHNSPSPESNGNFFEISEGMGEGFLLGSDHYYNLNQNWPQNNPTPQYAVRNFISLELLRNLGVPPTILELPSGSASDWPPITPGDCTAAYMTNIAMGMKGWNYYIYTGGPNVEGTGSTTDLYDYGAPIGPFGEIRPLYYAQKEVHRLCKENALYSTSICEDFYVGYDRLSLRPYSFSGFGGKGFLPPDKSWELCRQGLITTAFCAGFTPKLWDLVSFVPPVDKPLAVTSGSVMTRKVQENLVEFLRRGGSLMLGPELPVFDEELMPCTILADECGLNKESFVRFGDGIVDMENNPNVMVTGDILALKGETSGADLALLRKQGLAVSKVISAANGRLLWNGWGWTHSKLEHSRALKAMLEALGVKATVSKSDPNIFTVLHKGDKGRLLFVLNLYSAPARARVEIEGGPCLELELAPMETKLLVCNERDES